MMDHYFIRFGKKITGLKHLTLFTVKIIGKEKLFDLQLIINQRVISRIAEIYFLEMNHLHDLETD